MIIEPFGNTDTELLAALQPADWGDIRPHVQRYNALPYSHVVKTTVEGQLAGTGTYIFHKNTAWLALIITHPDYRGRGIGEAITRHMVEKIKEAGVDTVLLVATPMGEPLYKKLGFIDDGGYLFFKDGMASKNTEIPGIQAFEQRYANNMLQMDAEVSGENRENTLLPHLDAAQLYISNNRLEGYYLPTLGEGLIVAANSHAGTALMAARNSNKAANTVIPDENRAAEKFMLDNGFTQFRTARRMYLGRHTPWQPLHIYSRISGQLG